MKRKKSQRIRSLILVLWVMALCATRAVAAGGGHGEEHAASVYDLLFPLINFLLFVYLLKRVGGDSIRSYLQERRVQVISALDAAAKAKAEADQLHAEVRERLGQVDAEAETLRSDLRAAAELERDRRLKTAAEVVARINSDAQLVAEQEVLTASAALRNEMVGAAVAETVALLRRQIKNVDQERFLGDFVRDVQADR